MGGPWSGALASSALEVTVSGPRVPDGASPDRLPMPPDAPLACFGVLAAMLVLVVVTTVRPPGPLDSPDPARQRDGLLRDGPRIASSVAGKPSRVARSPCCSCASCLTPRRCSAWRLRCRARLWSRWSCRRPPAAAARAGCRRSLRTPVRGRGHADTPRSSWPVGYAVVDNDRRFRYATLNPQYLRNALEVAVIVGAVT
jgi:hypothetical protein